MNVSYWLLVGFIFASNVSLDAQIISILNDNDFKQHVEMNEKPVIVKFFASWCGACKKVAQPFSALANDAQFNTIVFAEVDIDKGRALSNRYSVGSIPLFLLIKNGKVHKRYVGIYAIKQIRDDLKAFI